MKILIVGTGVIGTIYGKVLSEKHEVLHFVREEKLSNLNNKKITFDIIDERKEENNQNTEGDYTYTCTSKADDSYDLIMVPVKSYQLINVLKTLVNQAQKTKYLLFTLDWNSSAEIDDILKKDQYIMGYAGGGGTFKGDLLWANIGDDIILGTVHKKQESLLKVIDDLFKACGITPNIQSNPLHWLWMHNIGSAPLGAALAKYHDMSKLLNDTDLVKVSFAAMLEGYNICEKRGVDLKDFKEVEMMSIPFDDLYPMFKNNFETNPIMQRYTAHAVDAIDEMVQNFKEIYKSGCDLGIDMPNMKILAEMIKESSKINAI